MKHAFYNPSIIKVTCLKCLWLQLPILIAILAFALSWFFFCGVGGNISIIVTQLGWTELYRTGQFRTRDNLKLSYQAFEWLWLLCSTEEDPGIAHSVNLHSSHKCLLDSFSQSPQEMDYNARKKNYWYWYSAALVQALSPQCLEWSKFVVLKCYKWYEPCSNFVLASRQCCTHSNPPTVLLYFYLYLV